MYERIIWYITDQNTLGFLVSKSPNHTNATLESMGIGLVVLMMDIIVPTESRIIFYPPLVYLGYTAWVIVLTAIIFIVGKWLANGFVKLRPTKQFKEEFTNGLFVVATIAGSVLTLLTVLGTLIVMLATLLSIIMNVPLPSNVVAIYGFTMWGLLGAYGIYKLYLWLKKSIKEC